MAINGTESVVTGAQSGGSLDFSTFYNVIDGKLSPSKETRHGINPATEELNPEVPVSTPEDVDRAVEAGQRAFRSWSKTTYAERQKALLAFADALEAERDNFAKLLVQEQGKPVSSGADPCCMPWFD
jgi:acyl-CoA reductase-like NAD-dependent aldehyde dehydrogenase